MERKIEAVFIDWNGTLCTSRFWEHLDETSTVEEEVFRSGKLSAHFDPWMKGELTTEEFLQIVSDETGLEYKMLLRELEISCKAMQLVDPSVINLVSEIRQKGVKVVIATDNMDTFNRWTRPSMNIDGHFDGILNSFDLKARKSDFDEDGNSLFFGSYFSEHDIDPRKTILIDDTEDKGNLQGRLGMDYRRIEFGKGLVLELEKILQELDENQQLPG